MSMNKNPVCVMGIGTSVPAPVSTDLYGKLLDRVFVVAAEQLDTKQLAGQMRAKDIAELRKWSIRILKSAGIDQRHMCILSRDIGATAEELATFGPDHKKFDNICYLKHDAEWYYEDRRKVWKKYAAELATESAAEALKAWGGDKDRVAYVAVHSVSGWAIPSLAQHVAFNHELSLDCRSIPVTLAGCHAGFLTTSVAWSMLMSNSANFEGQKGRDPVCLAMTSDEMGTLAKMYGGDRILDRDLHLANLLFGEGSAAVLLGRPNERDLQRSANGGFPIWEYHPPACVYVPNSADALAMYLSQNETEYFNTTIKKHLPMHINSALMANFSPKFSKFFGFKANLKLEQVDYVIHPGGKKLLELFAGVAKAFGHPDPESTTARSMEKLRTHGNMSSNSVLFILKDTILDTEKNHIMGVSMGPGVTIEFCAFSRWGHGPHFSKGDGRGPGMFSFGDWCLIFAAIAMIGFILAGYSL